MTDRKFAEWEWRGDMLGHGSVNLEVRMRWGGKEKHFVDFNAITDPEKAPIFYIKHPDPFVEIEHGDITELARLARETLESWFHIEWKPKLVVTITTTTAGKVWDERVKMNAGFQMNVAEWDEGLQPNTGLIYRRGADLRGSKRRYRGDLKSMREGKSSSIENITVAILDDTPENRAALKEVSETLHELLGKVQQLLNGEQLQQTLLEASFHKLLPETEG